MKRKLPTGLTAYKRTASFTQVSIPAGLRQDHSTKDGVWGLICVEEGELRYVITDPRRPPEELCLTAKTPPGVVEPTILHFVEPSGEVRFHVQFLRSGVP